jgi:hyperosmotically inducible protein
MQPAYMSLTSTSMIGYRAGVVDRVAVRMCRSAMVAFMNGWRKEGNAMRTRTRETRWEGILLAMLLVVTGAAMAGERSTGQAIDDTLITTKVKASFVADPQVSALAITVETDHGVVTLSGVVESEAERQRAIQLAQGMEGVTRVDANKLLVKR